MMIPPRDRRPEISDHLRAHRVKIAALNDFYWGVLAGFHVLGERSQGSGKVASFLPDAIGRRWDVCQQDVEEVVGREIERLRRILVVQSVILYEEYLKCLMLEVLGSRPLERTVRMRVDMRALPPAAAVSEWLYQEAVKQIVEEVLADNYEARARRIHNLLDVKPEKVGIEIRMDLVVAAGEVRNCIVHADGLVDKRAREKLKGVFGEMTLGDPLPLSEERMFELLSALKHHVEALDLAWRCSSETARVRT